MSAPQEPAINATVRAYVRARLDQGIDPATVRQATVQAFAEAFSDSGPEGSGFVREYVRQVAAVADATISEYQRSHSCSTPSDTESVSTAHVAIPPNPRP